MKTALSFASFLSTFSLLLVMISSSPALAFQVPPLPSDNFLENPWFRADELQNGNVKSSLQKWEHGVFNDCVPGDNGCEANNSYGWSTARKDKDPDSDNSTCNMGPYCGTAARYATGTGQGTGDGTPSRPGIGGTDAFLWQVVSVDNVQAGANAKFFSHTVTDNPNSYQVTIYGAQNANGPWTAIWTPVDIDLNNSSEGSWVDANLQSSMSITSTNPLVTTLDETDLFPFYKIEVYCNFKSGATRGCKTTGMYFSIENAESNGVIGDVGGPAGGDGNTSSGNNESDGGIGSGSGSGSGSVPDASSTSTDGGCGCYVRSPKQSFGSALLTMLVFGLLWRRRRNRS